MADKIKVPDGYSFVRTISSGGFGSVVEMIEDSTQIHYAGKMIPCMTTKDKERIDREVNRLRKFAHPGIVKLKEVASMGNNQVIVMELGGRSLAEIVKDYSERKILMPRDDVCQVMVDVSSALNFMHNHESGATAHGDVKMENILLCSGGHFKFSLSYFSFCSTVIPASALWRQKDADEEELRSENEKLKQLERDSKMREFQPQPKAKKRFEVKVPEPYKFIRTLGQGSFGSVHEVSKTLTGERFAMKILPCLSESDFSKNEHEIRKLSENQHRNVVGFVEAIEGDNAHFVVLELCSRSLHDELCENQKHGGRMDVVRVYRVMRDVLDGLAFLHSRGEIYGDLKGSNVLIGSDGTAKLGDFGGVVGTRTLKTNNLAECGTMQFWAPEFFKLAGKTGNQIGSFAGDMWAFGQLLLEMMTSRWWIVGESSVEIQQSVLGFEIGSICDSVGIVGEVQILLSLLLSKNPSHRISSAELVRTNRLRSVLGPETPLSRFVTQELESTRNDMELKTKNETIVRLERELAESRSNQPQPPLQPAPHSSGVRSNGSLASSTARHEPVSGENQDQCRDTASLV
ncbi:putative Mitogen-activated protein kinase kinase kinase 5 [Blattamonas nauphoetae]|uniref:Mitogen-activated protein kinase kinase kinase 5 n=1 Tax=Blattamonas nauphoetae TaxID=2049346 RepID=A0ABQ9X2K7_9EUKA|nr:putative Mitogen-activated protein kinase kinase kinase 5 [Blattamonas nauphoetae]